MLFKTIALTLATLFIALAQVATADAGCRPGHGAKQSYYQKQALQQSRARKAAQSRALAAAKQKKATQLARAEKAKPVAAEKTTVAAAEPTSVETPDAKADASEKNDLNVASIKKTCTKFIAETGTTVTVDCTQQ
ncbi:hypothetical protein [Hyphomicrobium sp. CS1GBMeth3]|uniref:hypothetical protein n=1 Tax=Hyphomicrobium sp. CS1GBMeth3 TaxID=1892845 RepID=UPI00093175B0|nr:hypothetical protein [Hyphomicrobium sp. CS1GBMeth3]